MFPKIYGINYLPTVIVFPFMAVMTSPGLTALPEGMFSQRGTSPTTLTGHSSWATAITVATTQAAPPMSPFMADIPAEGLMDIPPVSKVTPACIQKEQGIIIIQGEKKIIA